MWFIKLNMIGCLKYKGIIILKLVYKVLKCLIIWIIEIGIWVYILVIYKINSDEYFLIIML